MSKDDVRSKGEAREEAREDFAYELRQEKRALRKQGYDFVEAPETSYRAKVLGSLELEGGSCFFLELQQSEGQPKECVIVESPQLQRWDVIHDRQDVVPSHAFESMKRVMPESMVQVQGSVVVLDYDVWETKREGFENEICWERQGREAQGEQAQEREVEVDSNAELLRQAQEVRARRKVRNVRVELGRVQRMTESTPPDGQQLEVVASIKGVDTQHVVVQWTQREDMTKTQHFAVLEPKQVTDVKVVTDSDTQPVFLARDVDSIASGDKVSLHQGQLRRVALQALSVTARSSQGREVMERRQALENARLRRKVENLEFQFELFESCQESANERVFERSNSVCEEIGLATRKLQEELEELVWMRRLARQSGSWADVVVTFVFIGCVVFGVYCFVTGRIDLENPMRSIEPKSEFVESKSARLVRLKKEVVLLEVGLKRERFLDKLQRRRASQLMVADKLESAQRPVPLEQKEESVPQTDEVPEAEEPKERPQDYKIERVLSHDGGVLLWRDDGSTFFHKDGVRYAAPSFEVVGWHWEDVPTRLPEYPMQSKEEDR